MSDTIGKVDWQPATSKSRPLTDERIRAYYGGGSDQAVVGLLEAILMELRAINEILSQVLISVKYDDAIPAAQLTDNPQRLQGGRMTQWETRMVNITFDKPLPKGWEPFGWNWPNVMLRRKRRWWHTVLRAH